MNKESFVFYESVAKQGERLESKLGKETAYDFYKAVIDYGLYGVLPEEDSDVWLYGFEQTITSITAAKDRYAAAVENGKKGGRPKKVDEVKVLELKEKGLTNKQVAAELKCSESTIEKINAKNRETVKTVKTVKTHKNLNDNVNVNDNINDNANVNFNLTGGKLGEEEMERRLMKYPNGEVKAVTLDRAISDIFMTHPKEVKEMWENSPLADSNKPPTSLSELEKEDKDFYDFSKKCAIEKGLSEEEASKEAWEQTITNIEFLKSLI